MIQLKELQIPESTLDLRDFSDLCKSFSNYNDYVNFYSNQIKLKQNDLINYVVKILKEHFIKTESEWLNILNENDSKKLLKNKINENQYGFEHIKNIEQFYLRCLKTGEFFNLTFNYFNHKVYKPDDFSLDRFLNDLPSRYNEYINDFKILDNKIILYFGHKKYQIYNKIKNIYDIFYENQNKFDYYTIYTIDLLDYSVNKN